MSSLSLKRASASHSSGQWKDEDYDVLADGKVASAHLGGSAKVVKRSCGIF
jgi:hypothetical protein